MGLIARSAHHIRSTSMPSRSHPLNQEVDEKLNRLRGWESSTSTSSSSTTALCQSLCDLADLYESVEDLLQMPLTQQALSHNGQEKWVEQVLDGSLRLLDTCGTARDVMLQMKGMVQDLQFALRRRRVGVMEMETKLGAYFSSRRNIKQQIVKCLKSMKKTEDNKNQHLEGLMRVLSETNSITTSIFKSLLSFMSLSKPKSTWSSLGSKWMGSRRVTCEREDEPISELERLDASLSLLYSHKYNAVEQLHNAQNHLEGMEESIKGIEDGLDQVYKHLIQSRVSLLNILSN